MRGGKPECPECPDDAKYTVKKRGAVSVTQRAQIPGMWDEEGTYHESINPNVKKQQMECSNGHRFTDTERMDIRYEEKVEERKKAGVWNE